MRYALPAIAIFLLVCCSRPAVIDPSDIMSDTWVATDALGRHMPLTDSVGNLKQDKEDQLWQKISS